MSLNRLKTLDVDSSPGLGSQSFKSGRKMKASGGGLGAGGCLCRELREW